MDPVFVRELPQKFSSLAGNECEEGPTQAPIDSPLTAAK